MPAGLIALTNGAGDKNLETWQNTIGGNTVERQVTANGEQHLATYTAVSGIISTATANSHLGQVMAGSSLKVRPRLIEIYQYGLATTAALMQVDIFRLSTAGTGGTAITPNPLDPGDSAAGATAMTLPSAKGTETALLYRAAAYMLQTVSATAQMMEPILRIDLDRLRSKSAVIASGTTNGIAIKNVTAIAAGTVGWVVLFDESNF